MDIGHGYGMDIAQDQETSGNLKLSCSVVGNYCCVALEIQYPEILCWQGKHKKTPLRAHLLRSWSGFATQVITIFSLIE